jgi:H+/Cl- antiporter ClcA
LFTLNNAVLLFAVELQIDFDIFELLPVLLLGVIGGLLGSTFTYLNEMLTDWRKRGGGWPRVGGGGV